MIVLTHLKVSLTTLMMVAYFFGSVSAQVAKFDNSNIKLEIILDNKTLRFPEPVFGFVRITNISDKEGFFPSGLFQVYKRAIDGPNVELGSVLLHAPALTKVSAGYTETVAFHYSIGDKKQIRAILLDKSPLVFTFRTFGKPNEFPIEKLRQSDFIEYDEAKGFGDLDSPPATVHYSLEHLVFQNPIKDGFTESLNENFVSKTLDPTRWPKVNPHTLKEPISWSPDKYLDSSYFLGRDDEYLFNHVPVVQLFPRQIRTLQNVIRCDTATWRFLDVARIRQFTISRPESSESRLRAHEDFISVLRCMGRAEAYYHSPSPDPGYYRNDEIVINGKTRNLDEYMDERMFIDEVPGLYVRVDNPDFKEAGSGAPGNEDQSYVRRYIWKSLINDTTLPSPREASIKRWIDGGKQGPNPCPCWNEEEDAKVKIPVPVPDESEKD